MDNKITLHEGDRAVFERARTSIGAPPQWDVRLFRDEQDMGIAATINRDGTLVVNGNAKNARIEIPQTVGQNRRDQTPQLDLKTDNPVIIIGGDFVLGEGTARVPATATSLTSGPVQNNAAQLNGVDERFDENAVSITYQDTVVRSDGSRRTVTVEPITPDAEHDARIEFFAPGETAEQDTVVYTLSGKDSYEATVAKYNAINTAAPTNQEVSRQEVQPEEEGVPRLSNGEQAALRNTINGYKQKLMPLTNNFRTPDNVKADLNDLLKTADEILPRRSRVIQQDKLEEFHKKMDAMIEKDGDPSVTRHLKNIRKDISKDENKALQISMAPSDMPLTAIAAATDAARNLTSELSVVDYGSGRGQGDKAAPATQINISNDRTLT